MPPRNSRRREAENHEYDCGICLSVPELEVHMCRNGHLFCDSCLRRHQATSGTCPVCRVALPSDGAPIRCMLAERVIAEVPSDCQYCSLAMTRGEVARHELTCASRRVACVAALEGCDWAGSASAEEREVHEKTCMHATCLKMVAPLRAENARLKEQVDRLTPSKNECTLEKLSADENGELLLGAGNVWRVDGNNSRRSEDIFVTVGLPSVRLARGAWYYEAELLSDGVACPQFGWAKRGFTPRGESGCGDCRDSWAIDGDRTCFWHDGAERIPIEEWVVGDVIGLFLHIDSNYVLFHRNGVAIYGHHMSDDDDDPTHSRATNPAALGFRSNEVDNLHYHHHHHHHHHQNSDGDDDDDDDDHGGGNIGDHHPRTHFFPALTMNDGVVKVNFGLSPFRYPNYRAWQKDSPDFSFCAAIAHHPLFAELTAPPSDERGAAAPGQLTTNNNSRRSSY